MTLRASTLVSALGVIAAGGSCTSAMAQLREIDPRVPLPYPEIAPPLVPPEPGRWWPLIAGAAAALALLGLIAWLIFFRRASSQVERPSPLRAALTRLDALRSQMDALAPDELAHRVSVILREYLQGRYAVPAPYRTTEELYGPHVIQAREGIRERFGEVAAFYDRLEFAPLPASREECIKLLDEAGAVLRDERRYTPGGESPPPLPSAANPA